MADDSTTRRALDLLSRSRNVLVSGPPGTGKSRLLAEVAAAFEAGIRRPSAVGEPIHDPNNVIPIPAGSGAQGLPDSYPAAAKTDRHVFRTVFHQNSKYRDFVSGMTPVVQKGDGQSGFRVMAGTLYRASEHARNPDGAALLIIDEINRGPAVQIFGGAIVAIEADKRLGDDGNPRPETQFFELLDPDTGEIVEYALPADLYILAAMNQADASVEPLDVAFLRRWEPLRLLPNEDVLRQYFGDVRIGSVPDEPATAAHVFEAVVRAWKNVNSRIAIGRGPEFQIGHGVLMSDANPAGMDMLDALAFVAQGWAKVHAHTEEVFFGDTRGVAAALNTGATGHPFKLLERTFASALRYQIEGPVNFTTDNIYSVLRFVAG